MSKKTDIKINKSIVTVVCIIMLTVAFYFISRDNILPSLIFLILPIPVLIFYILITRPRIAFISVLFANYFAAVLS